MLDDAERSAEAPLSACDILDRLRGDGLRAPLQVYRALDKLMEPGSLISWNRSTPSSAAPMPTSHGRTERYGGLRHLLGLRAGGRVRRCRGDIAATGVGQGDRLRAGADDD